MTGAAGAGEDPRAADGEDREPAGGGELRERPARWTLRLGRALRAEGVPCTPVESLAAREALAHIDLADPLDAYFGLRAVFTSERSHQPIFDRCFWDLWGQRQRGAGSAAAPESSRPGSTRPAGEEGAAEAPAERPGNLRVRGAAYSAHAALADRSFASLAEPELREVDRALERLMVKLATRRSRRLRPARRRGKVDLRRSLRDALRHDGELLRLARRDRRIDRPRLVLLCDVSGSMERYSRFLLRFILTACREPDVETFVFSTRLTRLGPWLPRADADRVLAGLGARIQDWSGGTRIGASLSAFLDEYGRRMLGQRTVVIVLSDGLDQGEVEPLERAMRGIHRKARKVIWLNPLLESPDYRPEARGMKAALPYVDEFASGHSLEALRELTALVRL